MPQFLTISSLEELEREISSDSGEMPVRVFMPSITRFRESSRISNLLSKKVSDSRWEVEEKITAALDLASDRSLDLLCFKRTFHCVAMEIKSGRQIESSQFADLRRHLSKMAPYSENAGAKKILAMIVEGQHILRVLEAEGTGSTGHGRTDPNHQEELKAAVNPVGEASGFKPKSQGNSMGAHKSGNRYSHPGNTGGSSSLNQQEQEDPNAMICPLQDDQDSNVWSRTDKLLDLIQEVLDGPINLPNL